MKIKNILITGLAATLFSCSAAYRTGQTPDDVYYSPAPEQNTQNSYVNVVSEDERNSYGYEDEETQIRKGIQDPRYRTPANVDISFGYAYSPFYYEYSPFYSPYLFNGYSPYYGYNDLSYYGKNWYNPYYGYNYGNPYSYYNYYGGTGFYNPYALGYFNPYGYGYNPFYYTGSSYLNTNRGARKYNLNAYKGLTTQPRTNGISVGGRTGVSAPAATPERRTTGVGNFIRRVTSPSGNNTTPRTTNSSSRGYSNTERSYDNRSNNAAPTRSFDNTSSPARSSSPASSTNSSTPTRSIRR